MTRWLYAALALQVLFFAGWGARLLTQEWLQPGNDPHDLFPASADMRDENGDELVTAYATHRPDGLWSLLLINKDPNRSFDANLVFRIGGSAGARSFTGNVDVYQYSRKQYELGGPANNPYPVKAEEPEHRRIDLSKTESRVTLLPYSLTIVRGNLSSF